MRTLLIIAAMAAAWPAVADDEYIRWRETAPSEYSAAFWVKFDKLPSGGNPFREFAVAADADQDVLAPRVHLRP